MASASSAQWFNTFTLVPPRLRVRLSIMMFLQFAIWGAWFVVWTNYLVDRGYSEAQSGSIFATMALGYILSPLFVGQMADRFVSSERLMAVFHLAGAGMLFWMSQIREPHYWYLYAVSLGYSSIYSPTLALANSIAFTHLPNGARDFPSIRVLGTIGWIVAGIVMDQFFRKGNGPLLLAAELSAILGILSFFLPHTPPAGIPGDSLPFLRAVGLLKDRSFAIFYGVSFVITIVLAFYYGWTGPFLEKGMGVQDVGTTMGIGQWAEMVILPFLPYFLVRLGMKWVLAVGMLAWGIRYAIFSMGQPYWLVLASLALHGVCFDFFFAAGFIHVDRQSPPGIRASAQALFAFLTYGLGMWVGGELSGRIAQAYTSESGDVRTTDWDGFWRIPCYGVLLSLLIFVAFFHDRGNRIEDDTKALP